MPPKDCVEGGCTDRMAQAEDRLDRIDNPESGALSQIHEKINGKVSWTVFLGLLGLFIFIMGGAYTYTSVAVGGVRTESKDVNDKQDKAVDDLRREWRDEFMEFRKEQRAIADGLTTHRIYSGERVKRSKGE